MQIAQDRLNKTAQALENAQTEIRELIQKAYIYGYSITNTNTQLFKIIESATKDIKIPRLKQDSKRSLLNFANNQRQLWQNMGISGALLVFLGKINGSMTTYPPEKLTNEFTRITGVKPREISKGVPLQTYYLRVWKDRVKPVLDRLSNERALDPNDFTGRNSLRNLAEMEVRYQGHKDEIANLKARGVKIVACSSHADCSGRCAPYQGKLYSLDGTIGTIDGHRYLPLEYATENPKDRYTTKAGRVYQNGLLGFNCRHYLREYKGQLLPTISSEERKKEYAITKKQRAMERAVRSAKTQAIMAKPINRAEYLYQRAKAQKLYAEYRKYSLENERAFYPMRVNI